MLKSILKYIYKPTLQAIVQNIGNIIVQGQNLFTADSSKWTADRSITVDSTNFY
jgi:hypothetical protein